MMGFKFCPMCGEKLTNESFKFCPECGYKFDSDEKTNKELIESEEIIRNSNVKKKRGKNSSKNSKSKTELYNYLNGLDNVTNAVLIERRIKSGEITKIEQINRIVELKEEKIVENAQPQEELKQKREEEYSKCYGAFNCHYSEKRYSTLLGIHPEFFDGVCSIRKNSLVIQGKRKQKVIRFSNISSIEYNKRRIGASEMTLTLSGGNIIHLTAPPEAYNRIYQMWSEGDY